MNKRERLLKDRFKKNPNDGFALVIKGMDVWLQGYVEQYRKERRAVKNMYRFETCGGYVIFHTDAVCMVSSDTNVISLYHPLELEALRKEEDLARIETLDRRIQSDNLKALRGPTRKPFQQGNAGQRK